MTIAWDLDGVLRDLGKYLYLKYNIPYPTTWNWTYKDLDIFDWVKYDNYDILLSAYPTKLVKLFNTQKGIPEIWTCQPKKWIKYTVKWIEKHLGKCEVFYLTTEEKRKKLDENTDYLLIEDNPRFCSYDRIILLDKPYNQHCNCNTRIKEDMEGDLVDVLNLYKRNTKNKVPQMR